MRPFGRTPRTAAALAAAAALAPLGGAEARATVRVVTTTEDLASIAREVGGDRVDAQAIAKGTMDPHFVEAKPSYLLKLKKADLFVQVGLELEVGWVPPLLSNARNPGILPGRPGYLDASEGCRILERSGAPVDRSAGDVHPLGNPHYWLDPGNGLKIAEAIASRLKALDPEGASAYEANLQGFRERLKKAEEGWEARAGALKGLKVVTYHRSWSNFADRFGLQVVDFVEPRPGIPPSPAHLKFLVDRIRAERVPLILVEPYFDLKIPELVARRSGAAVVAAPPSVGSAGVRDYLGLFERLIDLLAEAAGKG